MIQWTSSPLRLIEGGCNSKEVFNLIFILPKLPTTPPPSSAFPSRTTKTLKKNLQEKD